MPIATRGSYNFIAALAPRATHTVSFSFSLLWTKVHQILEACRDHLKLDLFFPFVYSVFQSGLVVRRNITRKRTVLGLTIHGREPQILCDSFQIYSSLLKMCKVWLTRVRWHCEHAGNEWPWQWVKMHIIILAVSQPKFVKFCENVGKPS